MKKGITAIPILLVIILLLILAIGFLLYKNSDVANEAVNKLLDRDKDTYSFNKPEKADDKDDEISAFDGSGVLKPEKKEDSTWKPLDNKWMQYTNNVLGFSIKMPKNLYDPNGGCVYSTENGDHSYRPQGALIPVTYFEDGNIVYFSGTHFAKLGGETSQGGYTYFSKCDQTNYSVAELKTDYFAHRFWKINVVNVKNDADITTYLKKNYGQGCSVGQKTASEQNGVLNVDIQGDGLDISETQCPVNFMYVIKYDPSKGKIANWNVGQACTFAANADFDCYDPEMIDSFAFN